MKSIKHSRDFYLGYLACMHDARGTPEIMIALEGDTTEYLYHLYSIAKESHA